MTVDILLVVIVTTVIQSIFGVGVLLFGTPLLLLLNYSFINALEVLLPISLSVNALQLIKHHRFIDKSVVVNVLKYSVPCIVVFLFFVTSARIDIGFLVGIFLIFVALKDVSGFVNAAVTKCVRYERVYFILMGVIHGLTNLGGSLLTALVHSKRYEKNQTRATVAVCYGVFAVFQLLTLLWVEHEHLLAYENRIALLQVAVITFLLTEETLYTTICNEKYAKIFAAFIGISGGMLIWKSF
ncbi:MAG: hypothetical protein Kow0065_20780 [Methylomicrobium sp.]